MTTTAQAPAASASRTGSLRQAPPERREVGITTGLTHSALLLWAVVTVAPLLWALMTSLKSDREIFSSPWRLPARLHLDNFVRAWNTANIGQYFLNTIVVVVCGVTCTLLLASMVAYVLARYPFRGNRVLYYLFVASMTFPIFLAIVPLFFVAQNLGLTNSLGGLVVIYTAWGLPFAVFVLTAFFRTLPRDLAEAAFLDGCGHWRVFFKIMLPLARPGLVSVGIFTFLGQWNQYLLPLVVQTDPDKYVLSQGLANLAVAQGYQSDWSALFAGLVISIVPVLIVYAFFHRRIQSGLTAGALK